MLWSKSTTRDDDEATTTTLNYSTIHSIPNDQLTPDTPTQKNLFSRAFSSIFGQTTNTNSSAPQTPATTTSTRNRLNSDYSIPLNQSMRTFHNRSSFDLPYNSPTSTNEKRVNWGDIETRDTILDDDFIDSDNEITETYNTIRNMKSSYIPGTYPERFSSPYIPTNFKVDQDLLVENQDILQKYFSIAVETNQFLDELLSMQQFQKNHNNQQSSKYMQLKKEYAKELETSKKVYEGFHRLVLKYRSLKDQLKAIDNAGNLLSISSSKNDLKLEYESTRRSLLSKTKRIEEMERDLKRLMDQRDDLKTTILEYKNQNLMLKNSNEILTKENNNLKARGDDFETVSMLKKRNEMLETQITNSNEMFKDQTSKLKNQIFDLQSDLKKNREIKEFELYEKNKRIEELEKLVSLRSPIRKVPNMRSRPLSYYEHTSNRILSPIRHSNHANSNSMNEPRSKFRSEVLNNDTENIFTKPKTTTTTTTLNDFSTSDISLILRSNQSEDLTGFDNDRVTRRLVNLHNKTKDDTNDLSAIFNSPKY